MRYIVGIGIVLAITASANAQDLSCSQRYCKQMSSCREAVWRFDHCGAGNLDRDNDGLPCENVCKTAAAVERAREANASVRPEGSSTDTDTPESDQ